MEKHIGLITCYDETGAERVVETPNLDSYLRKIGVNRKGKLKEQLFSRLQGSANRSYWFMNYNYRDFTEAELTRAYYMPVCGVKEQPEGRMIKYVEWLTFPEETLAGDGFNDVVFSIDFVKQHESVYAKEDNLREIISSRKVSTGRGIDSRQADTICRILHAIWDTQLYDQRARIVILMDDPENESLELLRQVYLLMPCRLRLQMGYMTNVSATDLTQIGSNGGMPIYIMTASPAEWATISQYSYGFPVYPIDISNISSYQFNQEKLTLLKRLAREMDAQTSVRLDYVEKKVLENSNTSGSPFQCYAEILNNVYSGDMFWWYKDRISSVEELETLYKDQAELMGNAGYHKEALRVFFTSLYPASDLASGITAIVNDENYPNRKRLLAFLSDDMEMRKQISSIEALRNQLLREKDQAVRDQKEQLEEKFNADFARQRLKYESEVNTLKTAHDAEIDQLIISHKQDLENAEQNYQGSIRTANARNLQLEDQLEQDGKCIRELNRKLEEQKRENDSLLRENKKINGEIDTLVVEKEQLTRKLAGADDARGNFQKLQKAEKKIERLDEKIKKLTIAIIVATVLTIVFLVFAWELFRSNRKLKADMKTLEETVSATETISTPIEPGGMNNPEGFQGELPGGQLNTDHKSDTDGKDSGETSITNGPNTISSGESVGNQEPAETFGHQTESVEDTPIEGNEEVNTQENIASPTDNGKTSETEINTDNVTEEGNDKKEEIIPWTENEAIEILYSVNENRLQFTDPVYPSSEKFFHVKFAEFRDGTNFRDKTWNYLGTYVDGFSSDKGEQSAYDWHEYTGLETAEGFYGMDHENAVTYYLHIAFSNSKHGSKGFSCTEMTGRKYIGFYVDSNPSSSEDPSKYTEWKRIPKR